MLKHTVSLAAVAGLAVVALAGAAANAGGIPVDNPGFEYPALLDDDYDYSMDDEGWGYYNNGGELGPYNPPTTEYPGEAPEGQNVGWTNPGSDGDGGFAQTIRRTRPCWESPCRSGCSVFIRKASAAIRRSISTTSN